MIDTPWKVQAFLTEQVTGGPRQPCAPTYCATEPEAREMAAQILGGSGSGDVEVAVSYVEDCGPS
jgi:hypothetical protein